MPLRNEIYTTKGDLKVRNNKKNKSQTKSKESKITLEDFRYLLLAISGHQIALLGVLLQTRLNYPVFSNYKRRQIDIRSSQRRPFGGDVSPSSPRSLDALDHHARVLVAR